MSGTVTQSAMLRAEPHAGRVAALRLRLGRLARLPAHIVPASLRARGIVLIALSAVSILVPGALIANSLRTNPAAWPPPVLFAIPAGGLALAFAWLYFAIERPIRGVTQYLAGAEASSPRATTGSTPAADLPALLSHAAALGAELRRARSDASCLRASLEARVDARTRQAALVARRAERAAGTDTLTGLENRRVLERVLPHLFSTRQSERGDLAVVLIDLDYFKCLNDRLGHAAGDALLTFIGDLLRGALRPEKDRAIRLGGDEFLLILPDMSADGARTLAQRLTALFAQKARTLDILEPRPGLSVGVASLRQHRPATWHDLLRLADREMYKAKYHSRARR